MQVYDGANWIAASSSGNVSLYAYEYIATAGQTTFSGADTNGQTLSYAAGNLHVTYGGLDIPTADYTATNGTTVVLDDGALVGTIVRIVAFQSFVVADTYTQSQADVLLAAKAPLASPTFTGTVTADGLTVQSNNNLDILDADNHVSGRLRNVSGGSNSLTIEADPANSASDTFMSFKLDASEAMRIDSSGNVGIGNSSPNGILDIEGNFESGKALVLTNTQGTGKVSYIRSHGGNGESLALYHDGVRRQTWDSNGTASFESGGVERMRIDGSGTTSFHGITGRASGTTGHMSISEQSNNRSYIELASTTTSSTTLVNFQNPNGVAGTITTSGSSTSYSTSSDYRLKEADVPMTGATERVKALRPINFAWKVDGKRVDGFFAHELQAVVPEAAHGTKDAMMDEEYAVTPAVLDEEGNEITPAVMGTRSVPDMQGIDQSKLVPLLTATIQELIARIEALEGV
jgi:hypothetical protein